MHRFIEFSLLFIVIVILQVVIFNRIGISVYLNPLVYVAFILLLPMEISGAVLLLLAFILGMTMDYFMGTAGINTIATVLMAFFRPVTLNLVVGKDDLKDGGIPNVNCLGREKFLRYAAPLILLHNCVFFALESLSWKYLYMALPRIAISSVVALALVYFCQRIFAVNRPTFGAKS